MGYGNGYGSRHDRGGKRYNNTMTAHVWNAQTEESGQSNNGNLYFRKEALYSYGSHFVVGFIMPDGVALMNADRYSPSTSGHQTDAGRAIRNRRHASVLGLTELAGDWKLLPHLVAFIREGGDKAAMQAEVRKALLAHASALSATIYAPGESGWHWNTAENKSESRPGQFGEVGAYLARLVGLPIASWNKIKRDAKAAAHKAAAHKASAEREEAEGRALRLADMTSKAWREQLARLGTDYNDSGFDSLAKELRRARGLMLAAKSGKLATAGRLATIRARLKQAVAERESFQSKRQSRVNRNALAVHLATIRNYRDASEAAKSAPGFYEMSSLERAANYVGDNGRLATLKASAIRLSAFASNAKAVIHIEAQARRERERENAKREQAERMALWLAGEPVGSITFDAETGGAALRIVGDTLETSHGASVPLAHAVKVFRFVKLCRDRKETWRRNGHTIRVGHFQVDRIAANGDFVAGCHSFTWQEVERVAKLAGVFDDAASADAVEPSAHAA